MYQSMFDPKTYLASFCSFGKGRDRILNFRLQKCFETFGPGGVGGDTLIDIGSGPSIYQLASACESFRNIIATDFTDCNRQEFQKWLNNEPGSFDWSELLQAVCNLEGNRENWREKEDKLRATIKKVLKCDVTKSNPLHPEILPKADCLISALCLEVACKDIDAYKDAVRNITTLLKPGGHLVAIGVFGDSFYKVGKQTFFCLPLDEETVRNTVINAGYTIKELEVFPIDDASLYGDLTDCCANFFLVAKKNLT
ncbi:indolethylamine N-methyltransferase L homeolog [Xenopus laevis]|uniref:Indolethylamine N-methyltransferase L homeolog n=1 Tax=Xenopus laevis TaxID=8355 RepID=Q6P7F9_XENLA|nr:indolethylamine N-methyltransferase L homeolog [Xenopus laevis]AAH61684.1 MGC68598 protein [Xenopus laevis]